MTGWSSRSRGHSSSGLRGQSIRCESTACRVGLCGRISLRVLSPDYEIRPARQGEIATIRAIEIAAAELIPLKDLPVELREDALPVEVVERAVAEGRLFAAVCLPQDSLVGFALATLIDGSAHLHELDVLPSHGRRGLGSALVAAVAEWAKQGGFSSLTLTTFRHLPFAAAFYRGLGFYGLPDDGLPEQLAGLLVAEEESGLDRSARLAMRLDLTPPNHGA
ncbi:MAG: GNAT family N-acetyltransferase [Deltaproteobacteria bacterium]|nr:GNAT family N-acetyltransferase [Deltaproteobacteria bacterium]MBW2723049.1 GNAT family N-acetyltransferase [Deltaproteobacteria bacterium]